MPCRCDYMDPTSDEINSRLTCQNLQYLMECLNIPVPAPVQQAAANTHGDVSIFNQATIHLCDTIKNLTETQKDEFMYDGSNAKARALAEWSEKHDQADRERETKEARDAAKRALKQSALAKLTPEERIALGL